MSSNFQKLEEYLSRYDKFIISTHESPDADGLGGEIAFKELLTNLGKKSIIINSDPTPETVQFIDIDKEINIFSKDMQLPEDINDYAQFVIDTSDYDNIGTAYPFLKEKVKDVFIIDHHEKVYDPAELSFRKADSSSVCEIIYTIIDYFKKPLSFKSAQAIYTGMLFDTGSFRFPKTTSDTYRIAALCLEFGANPFTIYEQLYESNTLSSFELRGKILSTMKVLHNGKLIILKLTPEMLKTANAKFTEGEPSINLPLTVKGVVASILVKQDVEGPVKVSMRTKGDYNVADIASKNNGGGHKNAAGFKSKKSFDETYAEILKEFEVFFK